MFLQKSKFKIGLKKFLRLKTLCHEHVISDLNIEEIVGTFYGKQLQKTNQKEFRVAKVIIRKGDKLYVKCRGYDSSFNSGIDEKDIIT